ncbi:MAG TPA: helical backbone metal receptor, partial [Polyangia bacterium]
MLTRGALRLLGALVLTSQPVCSHKPANETQRPRVVSLHDVTTEIVVALGASDLLVAVADPIEQPEAVEREVAAIRRAHDVESVIAAAPTLLLGMDVIEKRSPDLINQLRVRGIEVLLGAPRTLEGSFAFISTIGERLGRSPQASNLVKQLRHRAQAVSHTKVEPPLSEPARRGDASKVEVFVYDCCDPPFTAGGTGVLSDLISRAGGRNVFSKVEAQWSAVAWEAAVAGRPQLIVVNDYAMAGQADVAGKRARLATVPGLSDVPTV